MAFEVSKHVLEKTSFSFERNHTIEIEEISLEILTNCLKNFNERSLKAEIIGKFYKYLSIRILSVEAYLLWVNVLNLSYKSDSLLLYRHSSISRQETQFIIRKTGYWKYMKGKWV